MTQQRPPATEFDKQRMESIKKTWEQKRKISAHLSRIKHKIAVYSGKGGVGKTTVAVNLAVLLAQQGERVGLMDADIDCPNIIRMMGIKEKPAFENGQIIPVEQFGVKVISMGSLQEKEEEAIIWRGPMIHHAITQLLELTAWGDLDFLVVDLPPGTSDAPLTIMQVLTPDGFVAVTTPQDLALIDAKRSINMIRKMNLNVFGLVENMSGEFFGRGAGKEMAKEIGVRFLGSIDMDKAFKDMNKPAVSKEQKIQREFEAIVEGIRKTIADDALKNVPLSPAP
ncbi:MAG: Mrp/NBP35 family ATP-binding protein [Chloroflexi bacterium]|nr:Mrp/NBP35 family ATP-binding protein [Chloroflexota bacterium]